MRAVIALAVCLLLAAAAVESFSHDAARATRLRRARQAVEHEASQEALMEEWLASFTHSADSTLNALKTDLKLPVVAASEYTIDKALGSGAYGEVNLITKGGKKYAMKTLKWSGSPTFCSAADEADNERKFIREVTVAHTFANDATLKDFVVSVDFVTLKDGKPSVAMGLARVPKDVVYTAGFWKPTKVLGGLKDIAKAIERMHALKYSWDDVALRNVLVAAGSDTLLATDFGRTVKIGEARDCCAAPEYNNDCHSYPSTAVAANDMYAFGSLVWSMLSGQAYSHPWTGEAFPAAFSFRQLHGQKLRARLSAGSRAASSFEEAALAMSGAGYSDKYYIVKRELPPKYTQYYNGYIYVPSGASAPAAPADPNAWPAPGNCPAPAQVPHSAAVLTEVNKLPATWKGIITACYNAAAASRPTATQVIALLDAAIAKGDAHADNKLPAMPTYTS